MILKVVEAIATGRTAFTLTVSPPGISHLRGLQTKLLKPSWANNKLHGNRKTWRAGAFKGLPLYSLTLEERATCPDGCPVWDYCYGNNMPFATRFDVMADGGEELMRLLSDELDGLDKKHPDGYSLRLHILGDFFSVEYVSFWLAQLAWRPGLHIFGYTHRDPVSDPVGEAIEAGFLEHGHRFNILQSEGLRATTVRPVALQATTEGAADLPICPAETGKVAGCLDCGLCTLPYVKGVRFLRH